MVQRILRYLSALSGNVRYDTKFIAIATPLEESEKLDQIKKIHANTFHLVKKNCEDRCSRSEIALLILKKEEITEGKIYSPVGRFAERAKR